MPTPGYNTSSLTNVNLAPSSGSGELSVLNGTNPNDSYQILKYPSDIGTAADKLHYVTFYINLPTNSKYTGDLTSGAPIATVSNYAITSPIKGSLVSTVGAGTAAAAAAGAGALLGLAGTGIAALGAGVVTASAAAINSISLQPKLQRISTAISIYMPDTVISDYSHNYQETSVTDALGKIGTIGTLAAGITRAATTKNAPMKDSPAVLEAAGNIPGLGSNASDVALKSANFAVNPQVELIYKGTANREFIFEFRFQPRTPAEAAAIRSIIYTFRRFSAPELQGDSNGRYFINPGSFDIKFYFGNTENTNLSRISTCVLENLNVNYSGAGQYATFYDGMPAQIDLQLRFKEVDIITRELIEQLGY